MVILLLRKILNLDYSGIIDFPFIFSYRDILDSPNSLDVQQVLVVLGDYIVDGSLLIRSYLVILTRSATQSHSNKQMM